VEGAASTPEDTAETITLAGTDGDGDALTFAITTLPSQGELYEGTGTGGYLIGGGDLPYALADAAVTYDPALDFNGPDGFGFKASDGTDDSTEATVQITVDPVNDAPVCADVTITTDEDTADPRP
jgi:hypothetical protein